MKILFTIQEEKSRGINFMLKSLLIAAKAAGHETGLLVGYPEREKSALHTTIDSKIEHVDLERYIAEGTDSFKQLTKGGLRKRHVGKALLSLAVFRHKQVKIDPTYLLSHSGIEHQLDYIIKSPYFYQFLERDYNLLTRSLIGRIVKKYDIDLVVCVFPSHLRTRDVGRAKLIHFIHDAMPYELVESPPDNDNPRRYGRKFKSAAENSDLILVNSRDTAEKIKAISPRSSIQVLYGTASSQPARLPKTQILKELGLTKQGYLLFASTLEKRKNIERLLEAYARVADTTSCPLVLVGHAGYGFEDILAKYESLAESVKDKVIFTGYVSETEKYALFRNALAFVFPSLYEGFGLIVVEAMTCGLPVVTSRRGALPEAGGRAALYIDDPLNVDEIALKIRKVISDKKLRANMIKKGREHVKIFTQTEFNRRMSRALDNL